MRVFWMHAAIVPNHDGGGRIVAVQQLGPGAGVIGVREMAELADHHRLADRVRRLDQRPVEQ